jgi:outer membrane lipoprotein SlyB
LAGAAVSVMVLSGVGVAAMTGYLPGSQAEKAPEIAQQVAAAPAAKVAKATCTDCGVVVAVRQTEVKGQGTGLGAVVGGVAGAVVGNKIGDGRDAGTLLGAAGGAVAGHQIERHARTTQRFHVDVRMTDGTVKTVTSDTAPTWRSGDRVRLQGGKLLARG